MIYWSGRSTSGASHWKATTDNFIHLYEELEHQGVISTEDGDPYDLAILKKYNKSFEDAEFDDIMFNSYPFDYEDFGYQQPYVREYLKIGRNDPCPCGSGKKYKQCCGK